MYVEPDPIAATRAGVLILPGVGAFGPTFAERAAADAAVNGVQAAFLAAGFDSQAWVSPINATGAEVLSVE